MRDAAADGDARDPDARVARLGSEAFVPDPRAVACLDAETARRARVVPVGFEADGVGTDGRAAGGGGETARPRLILASVGEADLPRRDRVRRALPAGVDVLWRVGSASEVARALDRCYGVVRVLDDVVAACDAVVPRGASRPAPLSADAPGRTSPDERSADASVPSPIVRLVDTLLDDAVARGASDVHLSPEEASLRVRYRIDGVLEEVRRLERRHVDALTVRLKVLAGADIAETRRPQDGRFSRRSAGRRVDFRFSSFPLSTGENLVLRVLERDVSARGLDDLMAPSDTRDVLHRLVHRPDGLVVVSGPTGSGKTTTLYALLGERDATALNVMTLEDPIEHPVAGIAQGAIDAARGLDYAAGVRALLRQDPDVLLIGEVRDADSCAIALRAALTGHLVLTTVHASDAVAVVGRLRELGAEPGVLADVLAGVVAQRLVRTRCGACGGDEARARCCTRCAGRALAGRRAVIETLEPDAGFAALLRRGAGGAALADHVADAGHRTLRERAEALVAAGTTSATELERVFGTPPNAPAPAG